jgi:hypothetical protein
MLLSQAKYSVSHVTFCLHHVVVVSFWGAAEFKVFLPQTTTIGREIRGMEETRDSSENLLSLMGMKILYTMSTAKSVSETNP